MELDIHFGHRAIPLSQSRIGVVLNDSLGSLTVVSKDGISDVHEFTDGKIVRMWKLSGRIVVFCINGPEFPTRTEYSLHITGDLQNWRRIDFTSERRLSLFQLVMAEDDRVVLLGERETKARPTNVEVELRPDQPIFIKRLPFSKPQKAVRYQGEHLVLGFKRGEPLLFKLGETPGSWSRVFDPPPESYGVLNFKDQLFAFAHELWLERNGAWEPIVVGSDEVTPAEFGLHPAASDSVLAFTVMTASPRGHMVYASSTGTNFELLDVLTATRHVNEILHAILDDCYVVSHRSYSTMTTTLEWRPLSLS